MFNYRVRIGFSGVALHHYVIKAKNYDDAWNKAHKFLDPEKGYDYLEVKRLKK